MPQKRKRVRGAIGEYVASQLTMENAVKAGVGATRYYMEHSQKRGGKPAGRAKVRLRSRGTKSPQMLNPADLKSIKKRQGGGGPAWRAKRYAGTRRMRANAAGKTGGRLRGRQRRNSRGQFA